MSFTVFAPPQSTSGTGVLVQVWLHSDEDAEEVARRATEFDPDVRRRASTPVELDLAMGAMLRMELRAGDFTARALNTQLIWKGEACSTLFRVQAPDNIEPAARIGQAGLYVDAIAVAFVNFKLRFISAQDREVPAIRALPVRTAYLCYAAADREEVLRRGQILSTLGIHSMLDTISPDAGATREERTHRRIDQADAFFLFWSEAARHSPGVESEWRYALETKGATFITPIALATPLPQPPQELTHLHFGSSFASMLPT